MGQFRMTNNLLHSLLPCAIYALISLSLYVYFEIRFETVLTHFVCGGNK